MTAPLLGLATLAAAQPLPDEVAALARANSEAAAARERSALLERQADDATSAAARVRAQRAAIASRIVAAQADVAAAEVRIRLVAELRAGQRARLAEKQGPIVRLAAGLQTMARRPPALALVQRGSITDIVHVRAILAGQLPLIEARTAALRRDIGEGLRLQAQADRAAATLRAGQRDLAEQRLALARLEARHTARAQDYTDDAMREEDRATAFGEEARDIVERMGRNEEEAAIGRRLGTLPGPLPRPPIPGFSASPAPGFSFGGLLAPAGPPRYRLPVAGTLVTGLGEVSPAGVRAKGLTLAPPPGAAVVAPGRGRILFAGPFRNYGQIVIIDHGGGWTSLVTHLARIGVRAGDRVDIAGPIGRADMAKPAITVELRHGGQPVDIVPLIAAG